jgi:hypothetical protein
LPNRGGSNLNKRAPSPSGTPEYIAVETRNFEERSDEKSLFSRLSEGIFSLRSK